MSGQHRRDSLTLGDDAAPQLANTAETTQAESPAGAQRRKSRSSSPAKRTASEMEGGNGSTADADRKMDIDGILSPALQQSLGNGQDGDRPDANPETRNARGASVDMLGNHQPNQPASYGTSTNTSPKSSVSDKVDSETSNTTSISGTLEDKAMEDAAEQPSLDGQVTIIAQKAMAELQDGQVGYVISNAWLQRVMARCDAGTAYGPFDKTATEGEIGPVDNSALFPTETLDHTLKDEHGELFVPLSQGVRYGDDLYCLPKDAYDLVVRWYGLVQGQPVIKRYAYDTSGTGLNVIYELHPCIFTLRKLQDSNLSALKHSIQDAQQKAPRIVASRSNTFQSFLARVKAATAVPKTTKVRLWRVLQAQSTEAKTEEKKTVTTSMLSPPASRDTSPAGRAAVPPFAISQKSFGEMTEGIDIEKVDLKDETNNEKYNGSLQLGAAGLGADQVLIVDEQDSKASGDTFASDSVRKTAKNGLSLSKKGGILSGNSSGRSSPTGGVMTRGRNRAQGRSKGTVGLTNLGNTCYMNSALQCIRATEELTAYFLEKEWKEELNVDNVLGHGGQIAKTYAGFLEAIYQPGQNSFTPRNFKAVLGKCGPQFSGYGQQDSQEFMSFLVDALHEDLNRIRKKPYTENPDSDDNTVHDPEAIKALGEVFRKNYRARNDSVVMDLFNGFYKNTMVCPECDKVSITFDPYSLLTLQLPIEHSWQGFITFFPLHGKPVIIEIDIDKHATVRALKNYIAAKFPGLNSKRLMFAEVFSHKFFRTVDDKQTIMEVNIGARDDMVMYELELAPSNFPAPKKKQKRYKSMLSITPDSGDDEIPESDDSPLSDRMMVPVFHRHITSTSPYTNSTSKSLTLTPSFITLTRAEAQNYEEIYRKVLGQVANSTTRDILNEADGYQKSSTESTPEAEQDAVMTTEDDASSTAEPSIQARSVESEDGIVDISVVGKEKSPETDVDADVEITDAVSETQTVFNQRPAIMEPGSAIPEFLHRLFELKYIPAGNDMIQTGWSSFDQNRNYPAVLARVPKPARRMSTDSATSQMDKASTESSDVDEIAEPEPVISAQPSFNDDVESEPEESSELFSAKPSSTMNPKANGKQNRKNRKKNRNGNRVKQTYGKKGKKQSNGHSFSSFARQSSEESDAATETQTDGNPNIIRLGEAIVVDWDTTAYSALFGGSTLDDLEGQEARKHSATLEDAELEEKRRVRNARKKHGVSLDDCFKESAKGEILTEENAWYCNRCKELRRASKQLEIWTTPDILVVHLKRFSANRQFRDKIDVLVDFPIEGLNLDGKVGLTEGKSMTYDLFAVDNHYGGLGGGHYTAFAKNFVDGKWYEYNDSMVSQRKPESVITTAAYLLFYRRRSANPLGSSSLQQLVNEFRDPGDSETNSEASESRADSPSGSGKGQRLDGSSLNYTGSSSALVVAGAGHPPRGEDGSVAKAQRAIDEGYDDADADDEGVDMSYGTFIGPQVGPQEPDESLPPYEDMTGGFNIKSVHSSSWQWDGVPTGVDNDDKQDSEFAADGDFEGGYENDRLHDFDDDLQFASGHQNSPMALVPLGIDEIDYGNDVSPLIRESTREIDDELFEDVGPVTEIKLEDSPPREGNGSVGHEGGGA